MEPIIICDNYSCLTQQEAIQLGMDYIQGEIIIDGKEYAWDKTPEEFFAMLGQSKEVHTSCINQQTYLEKFEFYLKQGRDVLCIPVSSGLSCTYQNALNAAEELNKKYSSQAYVCDTLIGGHANKAYVLKALQMSKEGNTAKEILQTLDKNGLGMKTYFIPQDLQFLKRGGRLNAISAGIGTLLRLNPIINCPKGELKVSDKIIGHKKAMTVLKKHIVEEAMDNEEIPFFIAHTGKEEDAQEIKQFLLDNTKIRKIEIGYINEALSCHCGPQTVAVFFVGKVEGNEKLCLPHFPYLPFIHNKEN